MHGNWKLEISSHEQRRDPLLFNGRKNRVFNAMYLDLCASRSKSPSLSLSLLFLVAQEPTFPFLHLMRRASKGQG